MALSREFYAKLTKISAELGMNPRDLLLVMYSESGLQSSVVNQDKKNGGAVGLIQFMPDTLKGLGVPKDQIKDFGNKSAEDQLDYVKRYIKGQMAYIGRPFKSATEYYHANFFPKTLKRWRGTDPIENANTVVVARDAEDRLERGAYNANKGFDTDKDGIITVSNMTQALMRSANQNGFQQALSELNAVAGGGQVSEVAQDPRLLKNKAPASAIAAKPKQESSSLDQFLNQFNTFISGLFPGMQAAASMQKTAATISHDSARDALAQAYRQLYKREPSSGELDYGLATANFETGYGRAGGQFARWASEGKFNWGALQSGIPGEERTFNNFKAAGLHPTKEKGKDASRPVYFYLFPNDVEAATAFLMSWGKPDTLKAAATGDATAVAKSMRGHRYYEGFWVPPGNPNHMPMPPFKEAKSAAEAEANNIQDYASALHGQRQIVAGGAKTPNKPKEKAQQMASTTPQTESFLERFNNFISGLFSTAETKPSQFVVQAYGTDFETKAEYFRILQSVLRDEIGVFASIHSEDDRIELAVDMPFSPTDNLTSLKEVASAVEETFKEATGGCEVIPAVFGTKEASYPEMTPEKTEIMRRKFQYMMAIQGVSK